jgi:hypothetical protein
MRQWIARGTIITAFLVTARVLPGQAAPAPAAVTAERAVGEFYAWYVAMWPHDPGPHRRTVSMSTGWIEPRA